MVFSLCVEPIDLPSVASKTALLSTGRGSSREAEKGHGDYPSQGGGARDGGVYPADQSHERVSGVAPSPSPFSLQ